MLRLVISGSHRRNWKAIIAVLISSKRSFIMFCPQCGTNQSDELKFCKSCGANLSAVRQAVTTHETPEKS